MSKRTDIHRPSVIIPSNYAFVGCRPNVTFMSDFDFISFERKRIEEHMKSTGGKWANHDHGGSCHVCGAWAMSTVVWYHFPTNTYIQTGETCADKMEISADEAEQFNLFRSSLTHQWKAQAGKMKAKTTLEQLELSKCWDIHMEDDMEIRKDYRYEEHTIGDIVSKLVQYGDISENQIAFLKTLLEKIEKREEIEAQRKAEHEAAKPLPNCDKRFNIVGKVLTVKEQEDYYGYSTKMLVQHDDGWKVWGTVPSLLMPLERGSIVSFDASVKPSPDDPKFGFYTRPTKPKLIKGVAPAPID